MAARRESVALRAAVGVDAGDGVPAVGTRSFGWGRFPHRRVVGFGVLEQGFEVLDLAVSIAVGRRRLTAARGMIREQPCPV